MQPLNEAQFYRRLHVGNAGDTEFYERVTRGAESVLELGCGWGRIALSLAKDRFVVGLDHNDAFLQEARLAAPQAEKTRFFQQDIRTFNLEAPDLPRTFQRILIPYNTLYSLGGADGVAACFERVARYLAPDGELWFDVYPMDALQEALLAGHETEDDEEEPVAIQDWEGAQVRIFESSQLDHEKQRLQVVYRALDEYDLLRAQMSMTHDYLMIEQLERLLATAGLSVLGSFGDFSGTSLGEDPEQVVLGACHRTCSED